MQEKFVVKAKRAIKKVAALGTGVAMLGATMTGALAYDLADYPSPFVMDGKYDSSNALVVGANAAASDTLGLVDISTNLQFESKECVASGGAVTVSGGVTEDIPLGSAIATPAGETLDQLLQDDDLDSLKDSTVTFQSTDYDYQEIVLLGSAGNNVTAETSLTSSEDDYQTDVVLEAQSDSIKYYYAFDESIQLNSTTTSDPLNIKFMGQTLKITSIDSDTKFTAYVGGEFFMDVGDSVEVNGKTITLQNVGNTGSIVIDVDGVVETLTSSTAETVNGLEIKVDDYFYEDAKSGRSATLIIGKEAVETYKDGDEYVGEDKDDPNWVWDIGNLHTKAATNILATGLHTGPYLGVENDFIWNDDSDNPPGVGECIDMPNNYVSICLDSLTVSNDKYATYTFEFDNSADLSEAHGGTTGSSVAAIFMHTTKDEGFLVDISDLAPANQTSDQKSDKLWISTLESNGTTTGDELWLYYEDTNGKTQLAGQLTTETPIEVNYDNTKGTDMEIHLTNTSSQGDTFNVTLVPFDSTDLKDRNDNITMEWQLASGAIASLGATASSEEASELTWTGNLDANGVQARTSLGTKDEDHRTKYGIIVRDPKSHGASDEVVLEIPNDMVQANIVVKGQSTVTSSGGETCTVADITPLTMTDAEVAGKEGSYNLLLVGGPCANKAVEAVAGLGVTCAGWDLKAGEGVIKLAANGNKLAMLVAGTNALDTRRTAKVVANFKDYTLSGTEALVKGTTLTDITVE